MNGTKQDLALVIVAVMFFAVIVFIGLCAKAGVWEECRAEHSFLYCQHLMSH
jgi:hypothetical protein